MSNESSYIKILAANSKLQKDMSFILEAKAKEIEKACDWLCTHVHEEGYADDLHQLRDPIKIHQYIIEVIDGITKVENGLAKNLGIILEPQGGTADPAMDSILDDDGGWT